jgi:hypothetical protein
MKPITITFARDGAEYTLAALPNMTEKEARALIEPPKGTKKLTAAEVAKKYAVTQLRTWAKAYDLDAKGGEIELAQRLLDAGIAEISQESGK